LYYYDRKIFKAKRGLKKITNFEKLVMKRQMAKHKKNMEKSRNLNIYRFRQEAYKDILSLKVINIPERNQKLYCRGNTKKTGLR